MPEWLIKILPWAITGLLTAGMAWGLLKATVKSLESQLSADRELNLNERNLNATTNKELHAGITEIRLMLTSSASEYRAARENDRLIHEQRAANVDERMNLVDERNNLISTTNQNLVEEFEKMGGRMEELTSAVLADIGKKPGQ